MITSSEPGYVAQKRDVKASEQLAIELVYLKARAGKLGLFRTMHALDKATQEIGWEIAVQLDPKQAAHRDRYLASRQS